MYSGREHVAASPTLADVITTLTKKESAVIQLVESQVKLSSSLRLLGPMNDPSVYSSYLDLLRGARYEICLPMLTTSPYIASVPIIQERARQGVRVRILLGSPKIVAKLRGETNAQTAREAIAGWAKNARGISRMDVRVAQASDDMSAASSMLIDGTLLRFDLYDPSKQRSLEGTMLELESPPELDINLIRIFRQHFDNAWARAAPTRKLASLRWRISRLWQWWAFAVFATLGLWVRESYFGGILASVAATFLVNAVVTSWPSLRALIGRLIYD